MEQYSRNISVLEHIIEYCDRIHGHVNAEEEEYDSFKEDSLRLDAVALCLLQIGELSGVLTDEVKGLRDDVPWRQIKQLRNIVAHRYGTVDPEIIWEVIKDDIPKLKQNCREMIANLEDVESDDKK